MASIAHLARRTTDRLFIPVLIFLFLVSPALVSAQLPLKKLIAPPVESEQEKSEQTEQSLERLQQQQTKAQLSLSASRPVLESTPPEQLGGTIEEVKDKQVLLFMRVFHYGKHIESIRSLEESRRASQDLLAKSEAWQGFDQPPPYPISLVDELRDAIHAQSLAIAKQEVRKSLTRQEKEESRKNLLATEKELRLAKEAHEKKLQGADRIRADWIYGLVQLKDEVAETSVLASTAQLQAIDESLALHRSQQTFLKRQLRVAVAEAPFGKEEFEQKRTTFEQQLKRLVKDKRQAAEGNSRNQEKLHHARTSLQKIRESLALNKDEEDRTEQVTYLQNLVETRKVQADTSAQMVELLKLWAMAIEGKKIFWEERYRLANSRDDAELKQASISIKKHLERIRENRTYIESNLKLAQNLSLNEQQRLAAGTLTEKERILAQQKLDAHKKLTEFTTKLLVDINDLARQAERFQEEIRYYRQQESISEWLLGFGDSSLELIQNIWNYELFVVEDTISVKGQPVTARRPVTVSKVAQVLLILIIGLWLTKIFSHRLSGLVVRLMKVEENLAIVVEKGLRWVFISSLLIFALITAKIPLTAFAFMGGALAIGVGFGAQALINNFISGVILLFEGPIKTGDLVEVEGNRGRVLDIGLRCSQIRRFDGVDILVPNSDFLQKSVVNWTLSDRFIRMEVKLGVAYGSPTREVARIITHALSEHGKILEDPQPVVLFDNFGTSALGFCINFWVEVLPTYDYRIIASDLRHMLDKRLREANITIAYQQLDVHLDSSEALQLQMLKSQREMPTEIADDSTQQDK